MHAFERVFFVKSTKEFNNDFFRNVVSVKEDTTSIRSACVVLKSTAIKSNLFAHAGDLLSVKVSEKVKLEDTLSYVRSAH